MKKLSFRIILTVLTLVSVIQTALGAQLLVPGGQIIGLEILNNTVTVAAFDDALGSSAIACGLQVGDRITAINGKTVTCVQDVKKALLHSDGVAEISVLRDGKVKVLQLNPAITTDGPKLGVYLKEGVTGVGTVTWYDPETGSFAALGHSVSDGNGAPVTMEQGNVFNASVLTVKEGKSGAPGQLMSAVTGADKIGILHKNTPQGIFGTATLEADTELLPIAAKEQIHPGPAMIRSTVAGNSVQEYSVEIVKIYANSGTTGRNMLLKVTDPALLTATGGIVQGMSGSPLVQDGKLIGAVTHVLVNDPTMGYGIFIENMLEAAG